MPFTPDKLDTRVVTVTFKFGDDDMTIKYRPREFSFDKQQQANKIVERVKELNAIVENPESDAAAIEAAKAEAAQLDASAYTWLAAVLVWWEYFEYVNEDGTPGPMIAITPARVSEEMETHTDFMQACMAAIAEDYNKGKSNGTASSPR